MTNRRRGDRIQLTAYLQVYDLDSRQLLGQAIDLSLGGMRLLSSKPVELDRQCHLRIELPEVTAGRENIFVEAQTLWSRPGTNPEYYESGFRLVDLYDHAADVIQELSRNSFFHSA